ncbi:acetyltransferase [Bacillus mycoides]|uniref:GNAT family N-acetyltransferase n=1 Tax=Bacillus TaxID=1386 RepID=UPI0008FDBA6B|nr:MULTISPECIES: GNAT family protein [Bacillus]MED1507595.1 GNAT family protein [Bacillus proteolyticus]OJD71691.1 hypothetical protein BAU27_24760 [Bacillus sp. NH11B]GLV65251.1 acetyltransferase [Bacillus mycoides]
MSVSLIENNVLCLREIQKNDIEQIRIWRNQEDTRKYFHQNSTIDSQEQEEWYKRYQKKSDDIMFIIVLKTQHKESIGTTALYHIDLDKKMAEFGRLMIPQKNMKGRGFGKQATILTCIYGFEVLKLNSLHLSVLAHNQKAIQIYNQIGFKEETRTNDILYMNVGKEEFFQVNKNLIGFEMLFKREKKEIE